LDDLHPCRRAYRNVRERLLSLRILRKPKGDKMSTNHTLPTLLTREHADRIALRNTETAAAEPEAERWTYAVAPNGPRWFKVEVRDETGFLVGHL